MKRMRILIAALLLLAFTMVLLTSCKDHSDTPETNSGESKIETSADTPAPGTDAETNPDTDTTTETEPEKESGIVTETEAETETETETTPETETVPGPSIDYSGLSDPERLTTPFWKLNVMHNECTTFIARSNGTISAKLLFRPTKIISVKSNDLTVEFEEGKDYTWDGET